MRSLPFIKFLNASLSLPRIDPVNGIRNIHAGMESLPVNLQHMFTFRYVSMHVYVCACEIGASCPISKVSEL